MAATSCVGSRLLSLAIVLTAATPSSGWIAPINNSNISSRRTHHSSSRESSLLVSSSSRLQFSIVDNEGSKEDNNNIGGISGDGHQLRIGQRVGSGAYGTVHIAHLLNSEKRYIAKRAWTLSELELNVPMAVMELDSSSANDSQRTGVVRATGVVEEDSNDDDDINSNNNSSDDEMKERAERCRYYWNVERHIAQKLSSSQMSNEDEGYSNIHVTPQFKGVFQSGAVDDNDNNGGGEEEGEIVPGYGRIGEHDNTDDGNNKQGGGFFSMMNNDGDDDDERLQHEWMVFEYIPSSSVDGSHEESAAALTLLDAMEVALGENHHLEDIATALNLPSNKFGDTLDAVFVSILEDLKVIHASNIVHRDVKPGNLLCDVENNRLLLIDFGSAADLDPSSPPPPKQQNNGIGNIFSNAAAVQQRRVGFDDGIAAISPIYSAPETFVKLDENPLTFDVFSAALIMCQLLFNLLDERTDAGFTQQLREANYDLDTWLENSLRAELRPLGFDDALEYLGERRGLWALMKRMLQPDPLNRISSAIALEHLVEILALRSGEMDWSDETISLVAREEAFFESVIDSFGTGTVNYGDGQDDSRPRPLHFLASFRAGLPPGLVLSEASDDNNDEYSDMSDEAKAKWKEATKFAFPGEVFVRGWNANGQADKLGIFEVGDRLRGVGELPFTNAGFEAAVDLIQRQPRTGGTMKLHFDRLSKLNEQVPMDQTNVGGQSAKKVVSQGTWKSKGRRGNQEDGFVLHEIKNDASGGVLLAGVFDGHAGTAASESVSKVLPSLFREELLSSNGQGGTSVIRDALEQSWRTTCDLYRNGCDENGECVVDLDPVEGIRFTETETGSIDLIVAGTTATIAAIAMNPSGTNELTLLNCGDSRTMLVGEPVVGDGSVVVFETRDHSPDDKIEIERLSRGADLGLDYSIPECSMSGSYLRVGDFQYALCRSLEGSYVTSKGIVSDADVTNINLTTALAGRQYNSLVLACDGLLEVMSSEEVGREVVLMRKAGYKADEVAKNLCGQALKKGSYDNISVIVLHLDDA